MTSTATFVLLQSKCVTFYLILHHIFTIFPNNCMCQEFVNSCQKLRQLQKNTHTSNVWVGKQYFSEEILRKLKSGRIVFPVPSVVCVLHLCGLSYEIIMGWVGRFVVFWKLFHMLSSEIPKVKSYLFPLWTGDMSSLVSSALKQLLWVNMQDVCKWTLKGTTQP